MGYENKKNHQLWDILSWSNAKFSELTQKKYVVVNNEKTCLDHAWMSPAELKRVAKSFLCKENTLLYVAKGKQATLFLKKGRDGG